jgi:hypothetical protein
MSHKKGHNVKTVRFSHVKGKLVERQGRKAKGPVKWQPVTERRKNEKADKCPDFTCFSILDD